MDISWEIHWIPGFSTITWFVQIKYYCVNVHFFCSRNTFALKIDLLLFLIKLKIVTDMSYVHLLRCPGQAFTLQNDARIIHIKLSQSEWFHIFVIMSPDIFGLPVSDNTVQFWIKALIACHQSFMLYQDNGSHKLLGSFFIFHLYDKLPLLRQITIGPSIHFWPIWDDFMWWGNNSWFHYFHNT